jgi:ribonucleoside-diphosphate reductase alpha chain
MRVLKRNGKYEDVSFDKVITRIRNIAMNCGGLDGIELDELAQKICSHIFDGVQTSELDELTGRLAASLITKHPDYGVLASRIVISNHQKNTMNSFSDKMMLLYHNTECISKEFYKNLKKYKNVIDKYIDYERDFSYDYFAFKTLERSYLLKIKTKIIERPQDMLMRVSLFLRGNNSIDEVLECYNLLSKKYFIHATPTLFHSGSPKSQLLSCFLMGTQDSIKGIYKTISDCAQISKWAGGIGIHVSNIRGKNSLIRGTNGKSDGIIPMLKVYNTTALYVNQCILPDIIVYSKGGFKRMDEITTNDYLITKDGSFKKVNEIIINQKNEEILHIKTQHGIDPLKCTKIHDILTIKSTRRNGFKRTIDKLDRGVYKMKFIKADELTQEHLLGFPIPTYENDIDNFTEDNARMYGIILGDGSVIHNKKSYSHRYQISLNNDSKSDTMDFVLNYLEDRNIHYWINNGAEVCWTYNPVNIKKINITEEMIYDENREKILIPSFLHLPKNKIAMILKGLIETDGCITSTGIWFMSTSKNLIYSTKYLLLRFGILASVQTVDKVGQIMSYNKHNRPIISRKISYSLRMPKDKILKENNIYCKDFKETKQRQYFTYDNIIWSRVKEITKSDYSGKVYDFNMEDNHNYLTDNGLVHNSGKRAGSFAIYIETWHCDIFEFLDLKKTHGDMGKRALDLFYAMWISDLFMERVEADEDWSLFSPDEAKNLDNVYGTEFEELYVKYEKEGIARKTVKARKVWNAILTAQIETGTPYLLCKDAANRKSNQKNLGTIKSSNLCAEILEYSDDKEYACCTLASIGLPKFVEDGKFNHEKLIEVVNMVVENLNIVIDKNFYPVPETKLSNLKHRPIGLGVQGLADTFIKLRYPFDSEEARQLNIEIFETIYYAALKKSCDIAKVEGPYSSFDGSPLSKGLFQFDLWDQELKEINYKREFKKTELTDRYNWEELRKEIQKHGVRNSLLLACMPTASTGQILGNTECIEPITSNIYTRGTNSGTFVVVNKYLINDLIERNLWNNEMKNKIIRNRGSIQKIEEIPKELRDLYKTSWDLKMKSLINMASDRAKFIDQTQSMNLFIENPTIRKLSSMYFYGYRKGLKTLVYYLRQKAPSFAQQFTVEPVVKGKEKFVEEIKEKREKESTFLQKVYLKEKNCEKTRQRAHSITQETDEDELRQVQELMGSMTKGPVCESCMG